MDEPIVTLKLPAGFANNRLMFEEVMVEQLGENRFLLVRSPGTVLGLAAGDEFEMSLDTPIGYRILRRAGNVAVQIIVGCAHIDRCRLILNEAMARLGGRLDKDSVIGNMANLACTVPVSRGFAAIEQALQRGLGDIEDVQIIFGNVYDIADGKTLLNWWRKQ